MRILGIIFTLLILIIAGGLLAPQFIDWNQYKGQIIEQIESNTGFQAKIEGDLDLAVLPAPRVIVNGFALQNPAEDSAFITLDHADVYLDVMPLLSGQVSLKSITLNKPQINLRAAKDGSQNWMTDKLAGQEGEADVENTDETTAAPAIEIGKLDIKDGALSYEDLKAESRQDITNINGTFSMKSLEGPFNMNASLNAMGMPINIDAKTEKLDTQSKSVAANVKLGLNGAETDFSGVIGFGEKPDLQGETKISIANVKTFMGNVSGQDGADQLDAAFQAKGILTADANNMTFKNAALSLGDIKMSGGVEVENLSNNPKVTLNLSGDQNARIKSVVSMKGDEVKVSDLSLTYASSDVSGNIGWGPASKQGARSNLKVNINSTNLNIDEILSAIGQAPSSAAGSGGAADIKKTAAGFSFPFDTDYQIKAKTLTMSNQSYKDVMLGGRLRGVKLDQISIKTSDYAGLNVDVSGQIDNINALGGMNLNLNVKSADIEASLKALGQAEALKSLPQIGALSVNGNIKGDIDKLDFNLKTNAMNANIEAVGTVLTPLANPSYSLSSLGLKHPNLASLMQKLQSGSEKNAALAQAVDMNAKVDINGDTYVLSDLKGAFGSTSINGDITANVGGNIPKISGTLKTNKLALETFMGKASSGSAGSNAGGASGGGKWPKDKIDTAWLNSADVDLNLSSSQITYGGWQFDQPSFGLEMKDGTLKINNWNAGLFGGKSNVNFSLSGGNALKVNTDLALDNVGLQSLVTALAGAPIVQSQGIADFNTNLSASGASMHDLINNLSGQGTINGTDITVRGINVADLSRAMSNTDSLGRQAEALFKTGIRGGSSKFETLSGDFTVTNGVANFSKLNLVGNDADVVTLGNVSLPAWTIDMKSSVQLKVAADVEPPPPFEISYRGSLSNPGSSFAQNALEGYLNKKLSAKAGQLIQDKLGDKLNGELGGIVGNLFGVQVPQNQQPAPAPVQQKDGIQTEQLPPQGQNQTPPSSPYTSDGSQLQQQKQEQQQPEKIEPEDVIKDVLKGFLQ